MADADPIEAPTAERREPWRAHAGRVAWPTILLLAGVLGGAGTLWSLALADRLSPLLGVPLATALAYAAFTPMHEAAHGNVSGARGRGSWLDDLVGWLASSILFAPYSAFRVLHLTHHSHTNDPERDPDHFVAGTSPARVALRCLWIVPHYLRDFFAGPTSATRAAQAGRTSAILYFALEGAVVLGLALAGHGRAVLLFWALPALLASGLLAFAFDWLPHHPHAVRERHRDTRVVLGPGLSLLTFAQNYHLVHHLWPRVPFYRYRAVFEATRPELEARGAPILALGSRSR
jgi:fatty acid desaturase